MFLLSAKIHTIVIVDTMCYMNSHLGKYGKRSSLEMAVKEDLALYLILKFASILKKNVLLKSICGFSLCKKVTATRCRQDLQTYPLDLLLLGHLKNTINNTEAQDL